MLRYLCMPCGLVFGCRSRVDVTCEEEFVLNISIFKRKTAKLTIDKLKYVFTCKQESEYNPEEGERKSSNQSINFNN